MITIARPARSLLPSAETISAAPIGTSMIEKTDYAQHSPHPMRSSKLKSRRPLIARDPPLSLTEVSIVAMHERSWNEDNRATRVSFRTTRVSRYCRPGVEFHGRQLCLR